MSQSGQQNGSGKGWPRRRLLQTSIPLGAAAIVAACGGSGGSKDSVQRDDQGTVTAGGKTAAQAGAVPKIVPGHYERRLAASQEEINAATTVKRGGTYKFRYLDPPHFDAAKGYSCTIYDTHELVYNKAIRAKLGPAADPFKLELEPDLAEKWEQTSPDSTEFTLSFRKNVKWQNKAPLNGRAFTAEDAKLVYERYAAGGVQKDFFSMVDKMELTDPNTLRVKLKEPYVDFPATIATYSYITPRELWDNSDKIMTEAIGTGPFIRESWTPKQSSVFVRNPDYWEMGADGKALPYVDRAEMWIANDPASQKAGFRSGNWFNYFPTDTADGDDLIKSSPETVWLDVPASRGGNVNGFLFSMRNPKFKDKRVRNAISMGIDRAAYDDLFYDGLNKGYANTSVPWSFLQDEPPTLKDQGPTFQRNVAEAKKLLQAAGAENLEFEVVEWYITSGRDFFSPAQDQLREIGVKIRNKKVDNPTAITILANRSFDEAANMVWGPPNYSIDGWIYPWYITGGGLNYNTIADPQLDNLLKAQRKEADANKRKGILRQISEYLNDQSYEIWWPQAWVREAWPSSVKNFRPHGFAGTSQCYAAGQARSVWLDRA